MENFLLVILTTPLEDQSLVMNLYKVNVNVNTNLYSTLGGTRSSYQLCFTIAAAKANHHYRKNCIKFITYHHFIQNYMYNFSTWKVNIWPLQKINNMLPSPLPETYEYVKLLKGTAAP